MTKMNWDKAKRSQMPIEPYKGRSVQTQKQRKMAAFVRKHALTCFRCGTSTPLAWAKTGTNRRGPWAICADCVGWPKVSTKTLTEGFRAAAKERDYKDGLGNEVARRLRDDRNA